MRLDKWLSAQGYTRKQARQMVAAGRVAVEGIVLRDPGAAAEAGARVTLDGEIVAAPGHTHLMLNKPAGVLTATEDGRDATVLDLVPKPYLRKGLAPVGRLDKDVTGLLLLTTDGALAHRLISPKWEIEKLYEARVEGPLGEEHIAKMAAGVPLKDFTAKPARLTIVQSGEVSTARIVVTEGKYHQVKRMFGALGRPVLGLKRLSMGSLALDDALMPGECRPLSETEVAELYRITGYDKG